MSFIISAPSSGSGKTTITLGLLRALSRRGVDVRGAKSGPDYIDPMFHTAACGKPCFNLDAWAMAGPQIAALSNQRELQIIEGAMGLFDGAPPDGAGSTAHLARLLKLPIVLVIDASSMAQSVAALIKGFASHDADVEIAGVILNKVGSPRHDAMLRRAIKPLAIKVLGTIYRDQKITRPARHLGLVQAGEMPDLDEFLNQAADIVDAAIDLDQLGALGAALSFEETTPLEQSAASIAVARDAAFSFLYNHQVDEWNRSGVAIKYFSPLANDPVPQADRVFLPGGYPELYAATLSGNETFLTSLRTIARSTPVFGECGGYMVLGEALTDADGIDHKMAGLLPLHTSFAQRKLHLGYRTLTHRATGKKHKAHEFHYATTLRADGTPLFDAVDAEENDLGTMGLVEGNVSGSFAHLIA